MGLVIPFHARASSGNGYKSGLNSCLETPDNRSTDNTRSGGTSSHCEIAWMVTPSGVASPANPPTALIARFNASLRSSMGTMSSTALRQSQAPLHSGAQAMLYNVGMTLGERIKTARERLRPELSQTALGEHFGISGKAVSGWECNASVPKPDKLPKLRRILKVPYIWLLEGTGPPPDPDDPTLDDLAPRDRATVETVIYSLHRKTKPAA